MGCLFPGFSASFPEKSILDYKVHHPINQVFTVDENLFDGSQNQVPRKLDCRCTHPFAGYHNPIYI